MTLSSLNNSSLTGTKATGFFGSDLDQDAAETLLLTRWEEKLREREPGLFQSKDWDERVRHPVVSTYHWAALFTEEVRAIIRAHVNDTPPRITATGKVIDWMPLQRDVLAPPTSSDPKKFKTWQRKLGAVIRARQWADEHGIPYRFQVRTALKRIYFGRYYLLQRATLPDPALLNGEALRETVLLAWVEQLEAQIQHGDHPRYVLTNGDRHPDVAKHQIWLMSQIRRRNQPQFALAKFIRLGLLDPKLAALAFPKHIERALALAA